MEPEYVLPHPSLLQLGRSKIITSLRSAGQSLEETIKHIKEDLVPAFSRSSTSPHYYGFVTGGATPAAKFADHVAVDVDQNVQVHLPNETIATDVEAAALRMLCQLLRLDPEAWPHRTLTTGATASNVAGLACGRQQILAGNVAEILTTAAHSSLKKAASVVGIGRASVIDVSRVEAPHKFDLTRLAEQLTKPETASIVAVSCAEVNTGFFATTGDEMLEIRRLCDEHNAWLHVDAAFGALARLLPETTEYQYVRAGVAGLDLADSITGDAHKLVNVPYDCGFFFSKSLDNATEVFKNPNAAYLSSSSAADIPSPLNIGLENSRRFRALPVYATLFTYGESGYCDMIERQVKLARAIAQYIADHKGYELLPVSADTRQVQLQSVFIVVLFRASDDAVNNEIVQRVNNTRKIYVSGTSWNGQPAARFAVANWQVDVERDYQRVKEVLDSILR